eukprot:gene10280-8202_t
MDGWIDEQGLRYSDAGQHESQRDKPLTLTIAHPCVPQGLRYSDAGQHESRRYEPLNQRNHLSHVDSQGKLPPQHSNALDHAGGSLATEAEDGVGHHEEVGGSSYPAVAGGAIHGMAAGTTAMSPVMPFGAILPPALASMGFFQPPHLMHPSLSQVQQEAGEDAAGQLHGSFHEGGDGPSSPEEGDEARDQDRSAHAHNLHDVQQQRQAQHHHQQQRQQAPCTGKGSIAGPVQAGMRPASGPTVPASSAAGTDITPTILPSPASYPRSSPNPSPATEPATANTAGPKAGDSGADVRSISVGAEEAADVDAAPEDELSDEPSPHEGTSASAAHMASAWGAYGGIARRNELMPHEGASASAVHMASAWEAYGPVALKDGLSDKPSLYEGTSASAAHMASAWGAYGGMPVMPDLPSSAPLPTAAAGFYPMAYMGMHPMAYMGMQGMHSYMPGAAGYDPSSMYAAAAHQMGFYGHPQMGADGGGQDGVEGDSEGSDDPAQLYQRQMAQMQQQQQLAMQAYYEHTQQWAAGSEAYYVQMQQWAAGQHSAAATGMMGLPHSGMMAGASNSQQHSGMGQASNRTSVPAPAPAASSGQQERRSDAAPSRGSEWKAPEGDAGSIVTGKRRRVPNSKYSSGCYEHTPYANSNAYNAGLKREPSLDEPAAHESAETLMHMAGMSSHVMGPGHGGGQGAQGGGGRGGPDDRHASGSGGAAGDQAAGGAQPPPGAEAQHFPAANFGMMHAAAAAWPHMGHVVPGMTGMMPMAPIMDMGRGASL